MARKGENIFKRKDGRWEARYIHHYENGKAKYRYLYGASYKDVKQKKLDELCKKEKEKDNKKQSGITFTELSMRWLDDVKSNVKESTYTRYYRTVTKYIVPVIGNELPGRIDTRFLADVQTELMERGGIGGKPLAPKTVSDILCVIKAILHYGRENGISCPDIGRVKSCKRYRKSIEVFPEEKRLRLEQTLLTSRDTVSLGIIVTLFTGVRIGELCGLRWEDVDFADGTVNIRRTVERIADLDTTRTEKTKVIITVPKTESSIRSIPLPQFLLEYLRERKKENPCYLLTGTEQYTEPHQFYVRYRSYLSKHAYGEYTFHALRHTFATRCVELGFDTKALSEILGHANISTTLSVYVHPSVQQKKMQMERLTPSKY